MTFAVIGATGRVGSAIVRGPRALGVSVAALVSSADDELMTSGLD
jgi:uncharacterized protein YbjT (DUF2867 family)